MTGRALFAAVAPRLELAHRERRAEIVVLRARRASLTSKVLKKERLLAHRDLQTLRVTRRHSTGVRLAKLRQAERELEAARAALREVESQLP